MLEPVDRLQEARFGDELVLWVRQISLQPKTVLYIAVHGNGKLDPTLYQYLFCLTTLLGREQTIVLW